MALKIGRAGTTVELSEPFSISPRHSRGQRSLSISGHVKEQSTLADANELRSLLLAQIDTIVPVTSDTDPEINGYYLLTQGSVNVEAKLASIANGGFYPYQVSLVRKPNPMFESRITSGLIPNDHSVTPGQGIIAPPVGATSFTPDTGTRLDRVGDEGTVVTYLDANTSSLWSCGVTDFYSGAVGLEVGGRLVGGLDIPDDPTDWLIDSSLIRIGRETSGRFSIRGYRVSWGAALDFKIQEGGVDIDDWQHLFILENRPEVVTIRLLGFQDNADNAGRRTLDISLRRGSRFASFYYRTSASSTVKVRRDPNDAALTTSMQGAGVRDAADDGQGNRWVLMTSKSHTANTTEGSISKSAVTELDFGIGMVIDATSAPVGDRSQDLVDQYLYGMHEQVSVVTAGAAG